MKKANLHKIMVRQQGASDCGVACLQSIIQYYGGYVSLEKLRELSGTQISGTTLLGLYQAANNTGFNAEGCEADVEALKTHSAPVILHVLNDEKFEHYVVCFGTIQKTNRLQFIIGDPAKGIVYLSEQELNEIWKTKTCLTLEPNKNFVLQQTINKDKRKWFKNLIEDDKPLLIIAAGLGIVIAILGVAMSIFSQRLIDDILPKKEFTKLYLGCALIFLILIIKEGLNYLRNYFLLRQSKDFNNRIIQRFYTHLLHLPKMFFDTRKTGEFVARLNDTSRIQNVINQLAGTAVVNVLVVFVMLGFLFVYSWSVALFSIISLPFYFWLIYRYNKPILTGQRKIMSSYALSESNYIASLQGIEPIKNHNKTELFAATNKTIYGNYQNNIFSLGKLQVRLSFWANAFGVLFLVSIIVYCGFNVMRGYLKAGELMAILGMSAALLPAVANLALVSIPINEAKIAFDRMYEFTGVAPETSDGLDVGNFSKLELKNISFHFPGHSLLLKNISIEIQKGEMIVLTGENGCGKSTIGQIIQRNYQPKSGNIFINETTDIKIIALTDWRKIIGVVPQNIHIFNGTVLENIAFEDVQNNPKKVETFLQNYGFDSFIKSLPQSYTTMVGEEDVNLSGGQKQMIAFARALYHQPQLLILDEATDAMDRQSEQFILSLLQNLKQKTGIIFITHRLHVLKNLCDRIYILENGVICQHGTHEHLLQTKNLYSRYWNELMK